MRGKKFFPAVKVEKEERKVVDGGWKGKSKISQKYYSCNHTYELDAEIAADLEYFLGKKM